MDPVERLQIIETLKKRIRKNNWNYLCRHNEIRAIIRVILYEVINNSPPDIYNYVADLFHCENMDVITAEVNAQLKRVSALIKNNSWTEYDGEMLFSNECSSKTDVCCENASIDSILKYSLAEKKDNKAAPEDIESEKNSTSESIEISVTKLLVD